MSSISSVTNKQTKIKPNYKIEKKCWGQILSSIRRAKFQSHFFYLVGNQSPYPHTFCHQPYIQIWRRNCLALVFLCKATLPSSAILSEKLRMKWLLQIYRIFSTSYVRCQDLLVFVRKFQIFLFSSIERNAGQWTAFVWYHWSSASRSLKFSS